MDRESMMIYFQLLRTHQAIHKKLNNLYIKRDGNGMEYTIGGHHYANDMQRKLMG